MVVKKISKLTDTQIKEMEELVDICSKHDGIKAELQVDESFKAPDDVNSFLLYIDEKLISFIYLFAPTKSEAELSASTLPQFRNQGLFNELLKEACAEIQSRGTEDLLYVCDRKSEDGQSVVKHMGAIYDFSEYSMIYTTKKPASIKHSDISIRESVAEDSEELIKVALVTSDDSIEDAQNYIKMIFSSKNRTQHVAILNGKIVGMISTALEGNKSYIHGLSVLPEYRRRGIGGTLLEFKVAESLRVYPNNEIEIEVMTGNSGALSIYKRAGFEIQACYDYFRKHLSDIGAR